MKQLVNEITRQQFVMHGLIKEVLVRMSNKIISGCIISSCGNYLYILCTEIRLK